MGNLDDNSQKPTEEAWSSVPKRGDKKVTSGRNNFSSRGAKSGRGRANTRGNDRGDRGRSAPATRTVRPNQQGSSNGRSNFNNNNRTSLDANGRDRNPNPRTTAGNAAHQFRNQQERKVETKTDASAASGIVQQQSKAPVQQTRTKVSANNTKKKVGKDFKPAPKSAVKWGSGAGGNSIIQKVKDAENKKAADEAAAAARVIAEANMAAARKANKNKPRPVKAKKGKVVKGEAQQQQQQQQQHKARGAQSAAQPTSAARAPSNGSAGTKAPNVGETDAKATSLAATKAAAKKKQAAAATQAARKQAAAKLAAKGQGSKSNPSKGINMGKWASDETASNFSFGAWGDDKKEKPKKVQTKKEVVVLDASALEAELTAQAEPTKEVKTAVKAVPASTVAPSDAVASPQDATIASTGAANTGTSQPQQQQQQQQQSYGSYNNNNNNNNNNGDNRGYQQQCNTRYAC